MTNGVELIPTSAADRPRPGSRADRMARPLQRSVLRHLAERYGVCVSPLAVRRIERATGRVIGTFDIPCGARLASKCKPCAERNRRLRQRQIREGWHLAEEPTVPVEPPSSEVVALMHMRGSLLFGRDQAVSAEEWDEVKELDTAIAEVDELLSTCRVRGTLPKPNRPRKPRVVRSTKRRQDAPKLPRRKVESRSVGRVYQGRDGKSHRPSMLLTVTLPGFGSVHTGKRMRRGQLMACECGHLHGEADGVLGTPMNPAAYDYREQALSLIFFPYLLDRFWQNYRRAAGWKVAYAGAVEMQRRLATHAHYAVRGTVSRALTKHVAAATYHQVWWPPFDRMSYSVDRPPVWDDSTDSYVDPKTREPLPTWRRAIEALAEPGAEPAYVARLGTVDVRGVEAGTEHAERAIRYATKYITKDLVDHTFVRSIEQQEHADRLYDELSVLPCSPRCANWLLYGVQPDEAKKDLIPGACKGRVHQRRTLGYTGRRCLVSRNWSNKTLTDHRHDGQEWFRALTAGLIDDQGDPVELDKHLYAYELARNDDHDVGALQDRIFRSIAARQRARVALHVARAGPRDVPAMAPATTPPMANAA
jgi:hypothetical protein